MSKMKQMLLAAAASIRLYELLTAQKVIKELEKGIEV